MLRVENLTVRYGDAHVLSGVSLEAPESCITCVLGPNGAGKTTLLRSVTGLVSPSSGRIVFGENEIQGKKTHDVAQLGLIMIPEGRRLWAPLSVRENLEMGAYLLRDSIKAQQQMSYVLDLFPHLESRRDQLCGTLSGGEQQMVAIGRGLMGSPKLLLLDEPSLGLAPLVVNEVYRAIQKIADAGTTILLVEQNTRMALSVASHAYVLETGVIVMEGEAKSLRENPHIKESYLGL
ncbi:MAG: ABC transporter ATP-binding protein [Desulfomonilaceae bacterium]